MSKLEDKISFLHREATSLKSEKKLNEAISCLREAEELKLQVTMTYPIKHYLRLPLFLQQNGQFDEAMQEFQKLLDNTESRVSNGLPKNSKSAKKMLVYAELSEIYMSMATACKREKMTDLADKYKSLGEENKKKHAKLFKADLAKQ